MHSCSEYSIKEFIARNQNIRIIDSLLSIIYTLVVIFTDIVL